MDYEQLVKDAVLTEWKADLYETLFALREKLSGTYPSLLEGTLDELAENYKGEDIEDMLPALGQEMTASGLCLYCLDGDGDDNVLVVLPLGQADEFNKFLKKSKRRGIMERQERKKPGEPARRIDLSKRIPCKTFPLKKDETVHSYTEGKIYVQTISLPTETRVIDLSTWPPSEQPLRRAVADIEKHPDKTMYAAVFHSQDIGPDGYLLEKFQRLAVGDDLADIDSWKEVETNGDLGYVNCLAWHGDDLLIACENASYKKVVKGFSPDKGWVDLLDFQGLGGYPRFFRGGDGALYFYKGTIHKYEGGAFSEPVCTIPGYGIGEMIPTGKDRFVFGIQEESTMTRGALMRLTELDTGTWKMRDREFPFATTGRGATHLAGDWIYLSSPSKKEFGYLWNFATDECLMLGRGALSDDYLDFFDTGDGGAVLRNGDTLCLPEDFWGYLRATNPKKNTLAPGPWTERA
ncbi:MAG: hypothetical protein FWH47_06550 [Methanomassiliicoccaceae archaeon]|nr:hypothetical protein [Methanomassiliicoccaceae archaeon]